MIVSPRLRTRRWTAVTLGALACAASLLLLSSLAFLPSSRVEAGPAGLSKIDHIVILIKENHSFDQYFGRFPGADGARTGLTSTGQVVPLSLAPDQVVPDPAHSAAAAYLAYDHGRMDASTASQAPSRLASTTPTRR